AVPLRVAVLGSVRTGRLDVDAVRGSLRAPRVVRTQALRLLVRIGSGGVRDLVIAAVRVALDPLGTAAALESGEVCRRACPRRTRVCPAHARRLAGPERRQGIPALADRRVFHPGARRALPQSRGTVPGDEGCAGPTHQLRD